MKQYIIPAVIALFITVGILVVFPPKTITNTLQNVGAAAGPDVSFFTHFYDNVNIGGNDFATSSIGTATYTANSFAKAHVIEHIAASALTVTLPTNAALSAAGYLPNVGDSQTLFIHASTTKITLAASTGIILNSASSTIQVAAGSIGRLECTRMGATEVRLIECLLIAD